MSAERRQRLPESRMAAIRHNVSRRLLAPGSHRWIGSCAGQGPRTPYDLISGQTMMITLCVALLLSLSVDAAAQPGTGRVTGTIVEARTAAPLAAVLVKVPSTGQQAFSDADGRFEITEVPVGSQTLVDLGRRLWPRSSRHHGMAGEAVNVSIPVAGGASTYVEDVAVSGSSYQELRARRAVAGGADQP